MQIRIKRNINGSATLLDNMSRVSIGVGDPDTQDPHVFGSPGSRSISQRYRSGSGSFPFLINALSGPN